MSEKKRAFTMDGIPIEEKCIRCNNRELCTNIISVDREIDCEATINRLQIKLEVANEQLEFWAKKAVDVQLKQDKQ